MMLKFRAQAPSWLALFILASCGGGSSSESPQTPFPINQEPADISNSENEPTTEIPPEVAPPVAPRVSPVVDGPLEGFQQCPEVLPEPGQKTVMVIDNGFDVSHEVFKDKIAGCFRLVCGPREEGDLPPVETYEDLLRNEIALLEKKDTSCKLMRGVPLEKSALLASPEFSAVRESWNQRLLEKKYWDDPLEGRFIKSVVDGFDGLILEDRKAPFIYHGTSTAGAIAYDNPDVKLVLVHIDIGSGGGGGSSRCPKQSEFNLLTQLFSDNRYLEAFGRTPLSSEDEAILWLRETFQVAVENRSFGVPARAEIEEQLWYDGCGRLNLVPYFEAQTTALSFREQKRKENGLSGNNSTVVVQAVGNSGAEVRDGRDSMQCIEGRPNHVIVGSYEFKADKVNLSPFSDRGACVDAYGLGSNVILAAPDNFLTVADGTSFASPLVARYVHESLASVEAKKIKPHLEAQKEGWGFLPTRLMPIELSFDHKSARVKPFGPVPAWGLVGLSQASNDSWWKMPSLATLDTKPTLFYDQAQVRKLLPPLKDW